MMLFTEQTSSHLERTLGSLTPVSEVKAASEC